MSTADDKANEHFDEIESIAERIGGETGVSLASKAAMLSANIRYRQVLRKIDELPASEIYRISRDLRMKECDEETNALRDIGDQIVDLKVGILEEIAKAMPKTRIKEG